VATIQDASAFGSVREFAAFLGLTPHQSSTGGLGEDPMRTGRSSPGLAGLASPRRAALKRFGGEARNEAVIPCGQRREIEASYDQSRRPALADRAD